MTPANFSILKACIQTDGYPHAPDPWRAALLRALDSQDLSAVARTSKPSFQWLLEEAPEAVLRVPVRAATADQGRTAARCSVVKEQLAGRGPDLPTVVALVQRGEIAATDQWWTEVFKALASDAAPIPILSLKFDVLGPEVLSATGGCFGGLTSLSIGTSYEGRTVQLPQPSQLPALRHLTVHHLPEHTTAQLWASVGPYMTQLQSLRVGFQFDEGAEDTDSEGEWLFRPHWAMLFTPQHTTHTLTHLTLPADLQPWLVRLLQRHTPCLRELGVDGICGDEQHGTVCAPVCSWTVLRIDHVHFPADALVWLPLPARGKLMIGLSRFSCDDRPVFWSVDLPLKQQVSERLQCTAPESSIELRLCGKDLSVTDQPAHCIAHREVCQHQLTDVWLKVGEEGEGWGGVRLSLRYVVWPTDAASTPTAPIPPLRALSFSSSDIYGSSCTYPMTDTVLAQMQRAGVKASELHVAAGVELALKSPVPQGTQLSFGRVVHRLGHGDIALTTLLDQGKLLGSSVLWDLARIHLTLTMAQVDSGEAARWAAELSALQQVRVRHFMISASWIREDHDLSVLRASLAIVCALRVPPEHTEFMHFTATTEVIQELRHLPPSKELSLHLRPDNSPVPLTQEPQPLARLPGNIPRSYKEWHISLDVGMSYEACEAFALAVPRDRTQSNPLKVTVSTDHYKRLAQRMEPLLDVYPCVDFDFVELF